MSEIERIMELEVARWIISKIDQLPDRGKFRAASAIRSLRWAGEIFAAGMPIPASYFALHATEEAVASVVSCAKVSGYKKEAGPINLRDHQAKATVSLLVQTISKLIEPIDLSIAVKPDSDTIAAKIVMDGEVRYFNELSTKLLHFTNGTTAQPRDHFINEVIEEFGDVEKLKRAVLLGQEARNSIMYATKSGLPTGFPEPEIALKRECLLTLGLIWTATDITAHSNERIPFIVQALQTASEVGEAVRRKAD